MKRSVPLVIAACALSAAAGYLLFIYTLAIKALLFLRFNDFGKFYLAVQQFRHGISLYAPNDATLIPLGNGASKELLNLNPPHFHFVLLPFMLLSEGHAYLAWIVTNSALLLLSWRMIQRELRLAPSPNELLIGFLLFAAAAPTLAWIATGQLTGILVAIITRTWVDARNERWTLAGCGIGLACAVKLFFGPLALYLCLRRKWRAVIAGGCVAGLIVAAGIGFFGMSEYRAWVSALSVVTWRWLPMNASITAPFFRIATGDPLHPKQIPAGLGFSLTLFSGIVILIGTWSGLKARRIDDGLSVLLLTCVLGSPLGWVYYHWIMAGPALVTFRAPGAAVTLAGAALLIPFVVLFPWNSPLFAVTVGSAYSWATCTLWVAAIHRARDDREGG